MNTTTTEAYICGQCGAKSFNKDLAEQCCKNYNCRVCGVELDRYRTICGLCSEKSRFEKAQKIPAAEYTGWVYWEGHGYNEGFFESLAELIDYCDYGERGEREGERNKIPLPEYVWACKVMTFKLDADRIIEDAYEEAHEGAADNLKMVDELEAFCKEFNEANKDNVTYYVDDGRVVMLSGMEVNKIKTKEGDNSCREPNYPSKSNKTTKPPS